MKKTETEIELDLMENGLDFIEHALYHLTRIDLKPELKLKYPVLHVTAGVELILKEILRQEHWSLLFENIDKADKEKLNSGNFQSASLDTVINRLKNIVAIEISDDLQRQLLELKKTRNRIEHFEFKENFIAIKTNISEILIFVLEMIERYLSINEYSENSNFLHHKIKKKVLHFEEYKKSKLKELENPIKNLKTQNIEILKCPECFQLTFPLNEKLQCLFCGYKDTPENITRAYIENILEFDKYIDIKDGGSYPLQHCPSCDNNTFINIEPHICFSCLKIWSKDYFSHCNFCNNLYVETEGNLGRCPDCNT